MDILLASQDSSEYYEIIRTQRNDTLINYTNSKIINNTKPRPTVDSNLAFWAVVDGVLLVFILGGNILTILAVRFSRRLRSVISNMFVLSLAISDILVGFTLPYHLAFYMGSGLGKSKQCCLLRFFLIILACSNSVWNLIAIAFDRYIAIFYPLHYSRYMTKKVAIALLGFGWIFGVTFALIPMFWNNWDTATKCEFDEILKPWYVAGIITPGFSLVWICMLIVYWRIWREATKHAKQLRSSFTGLHETPSDSKSVQVVLFILGCFSICWLSFFIIACAQIFKFFEKTTPMLYKGAFSLAMANSGMNPIIYAWKNTGFRRAFARLLRCQNPDYNEAAACSQHSIRSQYNHRKSSANQNQDTMSTIRTTPIHQTSTEEESIQISIPTKHNIISKLKKPQNTFNNQIINTITKGDENDGGINANIPTVNLKHNRRTSFASTVIINSSSSSLSSLVATPPQSANLERRLSTLVQYRKSSLSSSSSQPNQSIIFLPEEDFNEVFESKDTFESTKHVINKNNEINIENINTNSQLTYKNVPEINNCQNMVIGHILYDGNGNTQIRISPRNSQIHVSPKNEINSKLPNIENDNFELKLNCKDFRNNIPPIERTNLSKFDEIKQNCGLPKTKEHIQIEQLYNGNHVLTKKKKKKFRKF